MIRTTLNTVQGQLSIRDDGDSMDVLFVSTLERPLSEELDWMERKKVTVRYWVTDQQVSREQAQEEFMKKVMGVADVRYNPRYSEITGYLWTDEDLNVGGHDLIKELKSHAGKWLILEVEVH